MNNQSNYVNREVFSISFVLIMTDRGIPRTKFLKKGENCNILALSGNPNCAGSGPEHSMPGISCTELRIELFLCYVIG